MTLCASVVAFSFDGNPSLAGVPFVHDRTGQTWRPESASVARKTCPENKAQSEGSAVMGPGRTLPSQSATFGNETAIKQWPRSHKRHRSTPVWARTI